LKKECEANRELKSLAQGEQLKAEARAEAADVILGDCEVAIKSLHLNSLGYDTKLGHPYRDELLARIKKHLARHARENERQEEGS
jgi:hypothetical protein